MLTLIPTCTPPVNADGRALQIIELPGGATAASVEFVQLRGRHVCAAWFHLHPLSEAVRAINAEELP